MRIVGYTDRLSVQPGETIEFMVSSEHRSYQARIVELIHGDDRPGAPGFKSREIESGIDGTYDGVYQRLRPGSYACTSRSIKLPSDFSFSVRVWPTTLDNQKRVILSLGDVDTGGAALYFQDGLLSFEIGAHRLSLPVRCQERIWYTLTARYDAKRGQLYLAADPQTLTSSPNSIQAETAVRIVSGDLSGAVTIGATKNHESGEVSGFFNGKIESPTIVSNGAVLAQWDFSRGIDGWAIEDVSGNEFHCTTFNKPTRAVTGHNWDGSETSWKHAPEQYAAIHFHDDDLGDAGWTKSLEWKLPEDLKSAVYALHVSNEDTADEDYIPFFVRPSGHGAKAKIAVLLPTFSYLAYGNERILHSHGFETDFPYPVQKEDQFIISQRLLSLYDKHSDGSGVCYSSSKRPIVNMRPKVVMQFMDKGKGSPHAFNADLYLIDWLHHSGFEFDVLTDHDLHEEGEPLLRDYNVVITATHNEYWSLEMILGAQAYLRSGGKLFNLSGNGMYWVTQLDQTTKSSVEIRRRGPGTRMWETQPGEAHLSATGALGGLWRYRGLAPQTWLGNGFAAETPGIGRPYARLPDGESEKVAFAFEGIGKDELIGDFPNLIQQYGAAGYEFDRADPAVGTPVETLIVASATGFSDDAQACCEEIMTADSQQSGSVNPNVRCDMTFVEYPNGGAVFSVGSIAWCGALSYNNYENNVSRLTRNVVTKFSRE